MLDKVKKMFSWDRIPKDAKVRFLPQDPADNGVHYVPKDHQSIWGEGPCWCCHPTEPNLIISAFEQGGLRQKMIAPITEEEMNLDKGRFVHFSKEAQAHVIHVGDADGAPLMLDFIGQNIRHAWHIRRDDPGLAFSFASDTEAAMFALAFR